MSEDAYTDYCHLTPMGNKRLAEYLGERLLPILKGKERLPDPASPPTLRRAP
jgi:hypothetical protein